MIVINTTSDQHHLICTILKSKCERMPPKIITYRSYKDFSEKVFTKAIRSDSSWKKCLKKLLDRIILTLRMAT